MAPLYGMPPDPRPRKGTPEAIVLEQLEALNAAWATTHTTKPESSHPNQPTLTPLAEPSAEPQPIRRSAETRKRGRRPKAITAAQAPHPAPDPERHARKCSICNHPERDAIDAAFLQWRSGEWIALNFEITNRRFIYRHAHATGLFERRRLNFRCALENVLERGDQVSLTGAGFVSAIRAYASLDDAGHWNEPARRAIVTSEYVHRPTPGSSTPAPAESPESAISNQHFGD